MKFEHPSLCAFLLKIIIREIQLIEKNTHFEGEYFLTVLKKVVFRNHIHEAYRLSIFVSELMKKSFEWNFSSSDLQLLKANYLWRHESRRPF
jgi:hypothetical protein